jgi:CRP-like cAMP-binding protein
VTQDERKILTVLGPKHSFGEMTVLVNEALPATVTAEIESRLPEIQRENLIVETGVGNRFSLCFRRPRTRYRRLARLGAFCPPLPAG